MVSFPSKTYSKKLLPLISWSHWFTFFNIVAAIALSSVFLVTETFPETFIGQVYFFTNWLSHIAFLVFICFVLFLFPIILLRPSNQFIRVTASITYTIILLTLLLDGFIYSSLGYHLNASSSDQIIILIQGVISEYGRIFWAVSLFSALLLLAFQLVVSNYAWKHLRQLQRTSFSRKAVFTLVGTFFFTHLLHIWADANLKYDILRQDSFLPFTYPTTAKTLLTKYGMFDREDYIARKTANLSFTETVPNYPTLTQACQPLQTPQSAFVVLNNNLLTSEQIKQIRNRASASIVLDHHVDSARPSDAAFNMLYALPTIYKDEIIKQNIKPLILQAVQQLGLESTLTIIGNKAEHDWYVPSFDSVKQLKDISSLVFEDKFNTINPGLHVVYFNEDNNYQFELFMDALLLAQKNKAQQDIVWVSSLGNADIATSYLNKSTIVMLPNSKNKVVDELTSVMDFPPTMFSRWLGCKVDSPALANGIDVLSLNENRVIANTMDNGIMVFKKDESILIDQNGNFQSYSKQLAAPIMEKEDFPVLIDGVRFIKRFTTLTQLTQQANEKAANN